MKRLREILNEKHIEDMSSDEHKRHRQAEAEGSQWHRDHPVSHENIINHFHAATSEEHHNGMSWYKDAHHTMKALAHDTKTPHHQMAGLISNYSPQTHWFTNIHTAAKVAREKKAVGGPGSGVFASNKQKHAAHRMLHGEHYNNVLVGHKVRHFAHLIEHGGNEHPDHPHVVLDRHAHSVASGSRITDAAFGQAGLKSKKKYADMSQAYVRAAHHLSEIHKTPIHPHQVQAVTWLVRQRLNAQEDKGQVKNQSNKAKATWHKYANEHHPSVIGQEPGTGYGH
jgi:hypothetical protein